MPTESVANSSTVSAPPAGATPPSEEPPRSNRKPVLIVLLLVIVAGAVIIWLMSRGHESTDDANLESHVASVAPRVAGQVSEVDVDDNQMVQQGQILFRLDDHDYRTGVMQAQANLAAAEAAASGAHTGVPITETASGSNLSEAQAALQQAQAGETLAGHQMDAATAQASAAQAQLAEAQAQSQYASDTERRLAQLVAKNEVSQQQYDQAAAAAKTAAAAVQAAQSQANAAGQQVASANANVEVARGRVSQAAAGVRAASTAPEQLAVSRSQASAAQARVALAQAALAEAQLNLDYTTVRAPVAGEVGDKHLEVGQLFAAGQTALSVVPIKDIWVVANFKETQLREMKPGQTADIDVDAFDIHLKGKVDSIGAATGARFSLLPPENATGNYVKVVQRVPVKLVFNSGQDLSRLRPGLSVEAKVYTK